ncbi:3-deoxy-manno-octulosonate cytidylyltransferase [Lignipirellula cremea]|uniref:3-deoxy-manno-octulosonate cytidylyltransferase n=1 Tax=Lignipirellula cremea TaxID=2528010 RepID=A0A518DWI3_9BACT|nr:3-deoxy-manno-octulosonate cytidylyltransferase [Lignipirellula cremea]QDU96197.1 3-deoxy-manno-octulosonate cytidylyltransferase [Lignipirellula cremea]
MTVYGILPARLASTRLPRKLLLAETGRSVLQHTWEAACRATSLAGVIIAADSPEIVAAAQAFGADCELTGDHPSGTDRVAEVAARRCPDAEAIVNIQGDEPELAPENIDRLVAALLERDDSQMATLACPIADAAMLASRSTVKIALAGDGRALYFSRAPIPCVRDADFDTLPVDERPWLLHIGLYAYRPDFLRRLASHPPTRLEQWEKLEQLRALEMGARLQVAVVEHHAPGIDTPEEYAAFVQRYRSHATS